MGTSKRYAEHFDRLAAERITAAEPAPCTLPQQAHGPQSIQWVRERRPPVWVWVTWPQKPAERLPAFATGWNDRVVVAELTGEAGTRSVVVWRNAVSHRRG